MKAHRKLHHWVKKNYKAIIVVVVAVVAIVVTYGAATGWVAGGAMSFGGTVATGAVTGAAVSASTTAIQGGSWRDIGRSALTGAATGAVTAGVSAGILNGFAATSGTQFTTQLGRHLLHSVAHGLVGGGISKAMGGSFKDGFIGSAAGSFLSPISGGVVKMSGFGGFVAKAAVSTAIGGTASVLGGGKFSNGAISAAFSNLYQSAGSSAGRLSIPEFKGVFSNLNGVTSILRGNFAAGLLQIVGLPADIFNKWRSVEDFGGTGQGLAPLSMARLIGQANALSSEMTNKTGWKNGAHTWHSGTNALVSNSTGLGLGTILQFGAGLYHETFDIRAVKAEYANQGLINQTLDSGMDVVANSFGMITGLLVPHKMAAANVSMRVGNLIPGPADRDVIAGGPGGVYNDHGRNPTAMWGKYP